MGGGATFAMARGKAKPRRRSRPKALTATGPSPVWSWDITDLRTPVAGVFLCLYLVMDVYSRKIVGWDIHGRESDELAAQLIAGIIALEQPPADLSIHSDNPMKGATLKATLERLGVAQSFSRPATSNDNAFSESLFKMLKVQPAYPTGPFPTLGAAREWVSQFEGWYNDVHRHSAINFVTPSQRHTGQDEAILARRDATYKAARARRPDRWGSRQTRDWSKPGPVTLNPTPSSEPTSNPS